MNIRMLVAVVLLLSLNLMAQEAKSSSAPQTLPAAVRSLNSFYRMDYTVTEVEGGKAVNHRTYTLSVGDGGRSTNTRIGDRIPLLTGAGSQFNYMDVGVNIDSRINGRDLNDLFVSTTLELNTFSAAEQGGEAKANAPVVRSWKMSADAPLELGKQMLLGSSEEFTANRRFEVELKITRIK